MQKKQLEEDFIEEKYYDEEVADNPEQGENDEVDPLDLFMQDIEQQFKQDLSKMGKLQKKEEDFEYEDPIDSNVALKKNKQKNQDESDPDSFVDSEGEGEENNSKKKNIAPLTALDHQSIQYAEFGKDFYTEHQEITDLPIGQIEKIKREYQIHTKGDFVPRPIISFGHLNFDSKLIDKIVSQNFTTPTAIQAQALPCILSGRNVIGVAKTGSGKTVAYVWPLLIHVLDQRKVEKKEGPIGLIVVPTRELGQQVFIETRKYAQLFKISVCALLGGENKHFQWKELRQGVDIIIATPGRLIEMIKKKATNMVRCTYVVLDEADQMFSLGFEYQMRSILGQIRPDRQTLLFTATMKKKVKQLCMDMLIDPIVITIGETNNQVNEDIKQIPVIVENEEQKLKWLQQNINGFLALGKVLIFVSQIGQCELLLQELKHKMGIFGCSLHGDKLQQERTQIINQFKGKTQLMIATDIASRGLDIKEIRTVINFHPPKDADIYIHRIGRTGRAGNCDGSAYTLLLNDDSKLAIMLIRSLELAGQVVPQELEDLATQESWFKMDRLKKKMGFQYAKGKDASRMLQQTMKRQKNQKAGLGFDQEEPKQQKKVQREQGNPNSLGNSMTGFASMNTLAQQTKNVGQFKDRWQTVNPYENYQNYAATLAMEDRDDVIKHYQGEMKNKFREGFKSAGVAQSANKGPTVKYLDK